MLIAAAVLALAAFLLLPVDPTERLDRLAALDRQGASAAQADGLREWFGRHERRLRPGRVRARDRARCIRELDALASELAAGMPPGMALQQTRDEVLAHARAAAGVHGDVPAALLQDAQRVPELTALAGAWQAAEQHGAALAPIVTAIASDLRSASGMQRELDAELASAQASFRMLSLLPLVGIAFGTVMGAQPLSWLLGTSIGRCAFVGGIALMVLGAAWMRLIVRGIRS